MKNVRYIIFFFLAAAFQSCTKEVDFNQVDEVEITPNLTLTLVHFNLNAANFIDSAANEIHVISDSIQAPLNDASEPYIEKIELTVITENSFDRDFVIQIIFFDANQVPIYTLQPTIFVGSNTGETTTVIEIPKNDIQYLYNTEYFGFFVTLLPSTTGDEIEIDDAGILTMKSSMELFVNIKKQ